MRSRGFAMSSFFTLSRLQTFRRNFASIAFCLLVGAAFHSITASGQSTAHWKAGIGAWSGSSNWDCGSDFPNGCVPNGGTGVSIANGGTAILDVNASVQSIDIASGGLVIDNHLSLASAQTLYVGRTGSGTLTIQGGASLTN